MRWMYILLMLIVVSGCSTWPEQGKGGWAEEYHPDNEKNSETWYASAPMHIANEYEHIQMKLDWLKVRGINKCMPAQVYQAEMLSNRIKRMLAAEMYSDAQADLRIFYHQLNLLQNHFERVLKLTGCAMANNDTSKDDSLKIIKQSASLTRATRAAKLSLSPTFNSSVATLSAYFHKSFNCSLIRSLFRSMALPHTKVYLLALASILVPSV